MRNKSSSRRPNDAVDGARGHRFSEVDAREGGLCGRVLPGLTSGIDGNGISAANENTRSLLWASRISARGERRGPRRASRLGDYSDDFSKAIVELLRWLHPLPARSQHSESHLPRKYS
jgi:hypothetical protein